MMSWCCSFVVVVRLVQRRVYGLTQDAFVDTIWVWFEGTKPNAHNYPSTHPPSTHPLHPNGTFLRHSSPTHVQWRVEWRVDNVSKFRLLGAKFESPPKSGLERCNWENLGYRGPGVDQWIGCWRFGGGRGCRDQRRLGALVSWKSL